MKILSIGPNALEVRPMESVSLTEYFRDRRGLTITQPGSDYRRRPAVLINPEVAEPRVRRVYESYGGLAPREGVATIPRATVFGGGTIAVDGGPFLTESVEILIDRSKVSPGEKYLEQPTSCSFDHAVFAGRDVQTRNYGHFLVEVVPRLLLDHDVLPNNVPILIHDSGQPHAVSILRVAGVDTERVRWITRDPVQVGTLYWPIPNTLHPLHHSSRIFTCLREVAEFQRCGPPHRHIFVSRVDADYRHLLNEDEVEEKLSPYGFERVVASQLTFEDQIRRFAEASVVVGVCGAALTNMVFMRPGSTVIIVSPSSSPGAFFWDLAHHLDIELFALWGPNDNTADHGHKANFRINPDLVRDVVAGIIESPSVA